MQIDKEQVRTFYEDVNSVWPDNDLWHQYSQKQICGYIQKQHFDSNSYILNAGSGGSTYGLPFRMMHIDLAENKIDFFPEYTVASVDALPFGDSTFTNCICVGSVINYCDAVTSIQELSRVLKKSGVLILEFESSWGLEHINNNNAFRKSAEIVELPYYGEPHQQWLYSYDYIAKILAVYGLVKMDEYRFHYLSGLSFSRNHSENKAAKFVRFDAIARHIPILWRYSNNIIIKCYKL